jgi:transposase
MKTSATRVLVATTPVDLRGSFNRLYSLVVEQLKADPLSGRLFVFTNVPRNRIKLGPSASTLCFPLVALIRLILG